jgi:hypothetical protein
MRTSNQHQLPTTKHSRTDFPAQCLENENETDEWSTGDASDLARDRILVCSPPHKLEVVEDGIYKVIRSQNGTQERSSELVRGHESGINGNRF